LVAYIRYEPIIGELWKEATVDKPMASVGFKLMTLAFRVRDLLRSRMDVLSEAGIEPGFCVLDYGCGPGGYIVPLAQLVGSSGEIYALDIHPLAIQKVQKKATQKAIMNLKTIESDCKTGTGRRGVYSAGIRC
jgi:ubiquinone/menaquinone biosynthesis C-methylase UbiE